MKTKNVKNSKEITENNATTDTTVQASMDGQRAEADAPAETEEIQNTETVQAPTDHTPEALPTVLMDIAQLRTSPYNPRTTYEEEGIKELAATLRESGLLHPLHVRPKDGYYEIITPRLETNRRICPRSDGCPGPRYGADRKPPAGGYGPDGRGTGI